MMTVGLEPGERGIEKRCLRAGLQQLRAHAVPTTRSDARASARRARRRASRMPRAAPAAPSGDTPGTSVRRSQLRLHRGDWESIRWDPGGCGNGRMHDKRREVTRR